MRLALPHDEPGTPEARGPLRFLCWLVGRQRPRIALGALWGTLWMVFLMLPPYLISRAVDTGLRPKDLSALAGWAGAVLAVSLLSAWLGIMRHRTMTKIRTDAALRTVQIVVRQAARLGAALPRRITAGEVVSIGSADIAQIGQVMTLTGPGVGAVISCAGVAVLLFQVSPLLAAVVLLGVPVLVVGMGPLLGRLQRGQAEYRSQQGRLTARTGDIVAGLRVLSGIGGKEHFAGRYRTASRRLLDEGYRVGATVSWIGALAVGLPSLFLALITWLSARMAASGSITIGEMIAVYGYAAVLTVPVSYFVEAGIDLTRARVAARRVIRLLALEPEVRDAAGGTRPAPPQPAELHDPDSGLSVPVGGMLAVAADSPALGLALADRLARFADSAVSWGGVPLAGIELGEVRRRIRLADNDAQLFAGALREAVLGHAEHSSEEITAAIRTAAAEDVVAGLPDGLDSLIEAQARNLSGGQRQRLRLARALVDDPGVLILVEPTSAVDAHTEARIAERLHRARAGRTTVVIGTSPLLLDRADAVAHLTADGVAAVSTHAELLVRNAGYRALVHRGEEDGADGEDGEDGATVVARQRSEGAVR